MTTKTNRIAVRPHTYRGNEGFLIYGRGENYGLFGVKIFVRLRETAEAIRGLYKSSLAPAERSVEVNRLIMSEGRN